MTITDTVTTDYVVTFYWVAEDWINSDSDDESPMSSSEPVTVSLPSDATPWEVYCKADALDQGPEKDPDVYSWDPDGFNVEFNGKSLSLSGEQINSDTQWSDLY